MKNNMNEAPKTKEPVLIFETHLSKTFPVPFVGIWNQHAMRWENFHYPYQPLSPVAWAPISNCETCSNPEVMGALHAENRQLAQAVLRLTIELAKAEEAATPEAKAAESVERKSRIQRTTKAVNRAFKALDKAHELLGLCVVSLSDAERVAERDLSASLDEIQEAH